MKKFLLLFPLFLLLSVSSHSKEKVYKTYTDIGELDPREISPGLAEIVRKHNGNTHKKNLGFKFEIKIGANIILETGVG